VTFTIETGKTTEVLITNYEVTPEPTPAPTEPAKDLPDTGTGNTPSGGPNPIGWLILPALFAALIAALVGMRARIQRDSIR
jgi:hypothetical protein